MNINSPFPLDVDLLIDALDKTFPNQAPNPTDTDREVWMKAGQSHVVTFLKAWRKASLEKHPYVPREDAQGEHPGQRREARPGLHKPVLRKPRSRRSGRKGRTKRAKD